MKKFVLDPLPYDFDYLEPFIDEETMKLHHDKHHQAYTDKLNAALETHPELPDHDIEDLLKDLSLVPEDIRQAVRNHGGGYYNHNLFWEMLAKDVAMPNIVENLLSKDFGSVASFKEMFTNQALSLFGSGWVWLVVNTEGKMEILSTSNQDNPISTFDAKILLTLDLWEHSYYLKHQNKRADYIANWWKVVNWDYVAKQLS